MGRQLCLDGILKPGRTEGFVPLGQRAYLQLLIVVDGTRDELSVRRLAFAIAPAETVLHRMGRNEPIVQAARGEPMARPRAVAR